MTPLAILIFAGAMVAAVATTAATIVSRRQRIVEVARHWRAGL